MASYVYSKFLSGKPEKEKKKQFSTHTQRPGERVCVNLDIEIPQYSSFIYLILSFELQTKIEIVAHASRVQRHPPVKYLFLLQSTT